MSWQTAKMEDLDFGIIDQLGANPEPESLGILGGQELGRDETHITR